MHCWAQTPMSNEENNGNDEDEMAVNNEVLVYFGEQSIAQDKSTLK